MHLACFFRIKFLDATRKLDRNSVKHVPYRLNDSISAFR